MTGNPEVISSPVGLVPTDALVLTGLAFFRVVGYSEVVLGPDLFGGQVVNALSYCVGLSETDPPPTRLMPSFDPRHGIRCGEFLRLPDSHQRRAPQASGGRQPAVARVRDVYKPAGMARSLRVLPEEASVCPGGSLSSSGGTPQRLESGLGGTSSPDSEFRARLPPNVHARHRSVRN
jgi:hypothetical protein